MKNRILTAVLTLLAPAILLAQSDGVATFKVVTHATGADMPGTSKVSFSRTGWRVDMHMDTSAVAGRKERSPMPAVYDMTMLGKMSDPQKIYVLNDAARTYSVMDMATSAYTRPEETWTVQRTGRGSIAGLSCENATVTSSKGGKVNVCVSMDFPNSGGWWSAMNRRRNEGWYRAMADSGLKGFPIKMVVLKSDGSPEVEMELVSLERRSVPASSFEIPAGYKESSAGMGGMSPEQQKMLNDQLSKMTPEQRKAYEDAMKKAQQPH